MSVGAFILLLPWAERAFSRICEPLLWTPSAEQTDEFAIKLNRLEDSCVVDHDAPCYNVIRITSPLLPIQLVCQYVFADCVSRRVRGFPNFHLCHADADGRWEQH
jgi:hypothetical protein